MFCIMFHACSDFVSPILSAATRPTRSAIAPTATCVFITVVSSSLKFSRRTVRSSFSRDDGRTRSSNETVVWPICTRSVCVRLAINNRQQQTTGVRTRIRSAVECSKARVCSSRPVCLSVPATFSHQRANFLSRLSCIRARESAGESERYFRTRARAGANDAGVREKNAAVGEFDAPHEDADDVLSFQTL